MGIPIMNIRWSGDCFVFKMGIPHLASVSSYSNGSGSCMWALRPWYGTIILTCWWFTFLHLVNRFTINSCYWYIDGLGTTSHKTKDYHTYDWTLPHRLPMSTINVVFVRSVYAQHNSLSPSDLQIRSLLFYPQRTISVVLCMPTL